MGEKKVSLLFCIYCKIAIYLLLFFEKFVLLNYKTRFYKYVLISIFQHLPCRGSSS